jgi:hypothetical protein
MAQGKAAQYNQKLITLIKCMNMYRKLFFSFVTTIILSFSFQGTAYSNPTPWAKVESTLAELLNSGWSLMNVSSHRAAYRNSLSPGGFDETTLIFSLTRNGKYIICYMDNPKPPTANTAGCRKIN